MKSIEERVNDSIRRELERRPTDMGAWERFTRRVDRGRKQRLLLAGLAAAGIVAAATVVVPQLGEDRTVTPIESPSPTPTTSTSPTSAPAAAPSEIVALDMVSENDNADDRIVVLSTSTGDVVRVLAEAEGSSTGIPSLHPSLEMSPDGKTVYFVRSGDNPNCDLSIRSISKDGGSERTIAVGHSPAVSPDGRYLAYTGPGSGPNCDHPPVVVRDLSSGTERRWTWDAEDRENPYESGGAYGLAWAPDSRHLAFYRNAGDPKWYTWVLDTTKGESLLDATKVGSEDEGWYLPEYLKDGSIAVVHGVESIHSSPGGKQRIIAVDPANGALRSVLIDPKATIVAIAVDGSGTHLIYAGVEGIFRVVDGTAERVATGSYQALVW